jgi:hypothetical protein
MEGMELSTGAGVAQSVYFLTTDWTTGVRYPAGAKDFPSNLCVQTGSEAHPASCTMGTGDPFPGTKSGRDVTLTTHPHLVPRSRMSRGYTSSPPSASRACSGTAKKWSFPLCDLLQPPLTSSFLGPNILRTLTVFFL